MIIFTEGHPILPNCTSLAAAVSPVLM